MNSADPDQTPQNIASDQGLHCLLKECYIDDLTRVIISYEIY